MSKWYENSAADNGIIVSSRIRLARNLSQYPFPSLLPADESRKMIEELKNALMGERSVYGNSFSFMELTGQSKEQLFELMGRHLISLEMVSKKAPKALMVKDDESVAVMLNEEDHARIQTIFPGDNIDEGFELASRIDDLIEESVPYAFDERYGYLTSCPTNTGTGMRASFMLHLPALEMSGQAKNIFSAVGKFGLTVRGTHGEGTEPVGSMFQLSNQVTLGKTESEIIESLKSVTGRIIEQEQLLRDKILHEQRDVLTDKIYRSLALVKYARLMEPNEAMNHLSMIRLGYNLGIITEPKPDKTIYSIIIGLGRITNCAEYLRNCFS